MTYSTSTSLETSGSDSDSDVALVLKATFFSILIPLSFGGNLLVCITFCIDRYLKQVPSNFLIVSLAVADLLVTCFVMSPKFVTVLMGDVWIFGAEYCTVFRSMNIMCCAASVFSLCAISIDRYLRIKYALHYELMLPPLTIALIIMIVWVLSALVSFVPVYLGVYLAPPGHKASIPDTLCKSKHLDYKVAFGYSSIFFLPLIIMMVLYFKMFRIARTHANRINISTQSIDNKPKRKLSIYETKATYTLGLTTGVFVICWLPSNICLILYGVSPDLVDYNHMNHALFLGWANSCFNPMIYSIFNTEYRRAFKRILSCKKDNFKPQTEFFKRSRRSTIKKTLIGKWRTTEICSPAEPDLEIHETMDNKLQTSHTPTATLDWSQHTMKSKSDISICRKKDCESEPSSPKIAGVSSLFIARVKTSKSTEN